MGVHRQNNGGDRSRPPSPKTSKAANRRPGSRTPWDAFVPSKRVVAWVAAWAALLGLPSAGLTSLSALAVLKANQASERAARISAAAASANLEAARRNAEAAREKAASDERIAKIQRETARMNRDAAWLNACPPTTVKPRVRPAYPNGTQRPDGSRPK